MIPPEISSIDAGYDPGIHSPPRPQFCSDNMVLMFWIGGNGYKMVTVYYIRGKSTGSLKYLIWHTMSAERHSLDTKRTEHA
jgi:hypothetical protein